jgi:hypothetical protein
MGKRVSRTETILSDARERIATALHKVQGIESDLAQASATLRAHQETYEALKKALTPTPRKKPEKAAASAPAQKDPPADKKTSDALCAANVPTLNVPCGEREDRPIHDPNGGYAGYHPFERSKPVRAGRKSKQKSEASNSTNIEAGTESALAASGAGD